MKTFLFMLVSFAMVSCGTNKEFASKTAENPNESRGLSVEPTKNSRRTALIIGNSAYKSFPLKNPVNDANDMGEALRSLDFSVTVKTNVTRSEMRSAIREFGNDLKKGGVGLFFYAGHGMHVKGVNYLIPIGADINDEDEVQDESIDAGLVLRKMESAGNHMNMVFMDACRDNPFARSFRSSTRGLTEI